MQNRKIDIVVIKVMKVMEGIKGITITISNKLHDLLKKNGMKGESYEHIVLRLSRQEFSQDFKKFQSVEAKEKPKPVAKPIVQQAKKPKEQRQAAKKIEKPIKAKPKAVKKVVKKKQAKPAQKKANAQEKLPVQAKKKPKAKKAKKIPEKLPVKSEKIPVSDELKQWLYTKNLELQGLKTELELAKLSNDTAKINEISLRLAKLKEEYQQNKQIKIS